MRCQVEQNITFYLFWRDHTRREKLSGMANSSGLREQVETFRLFSAAHFRCTSQGFQVIGGNIPLDLSS